MIELLTVAAIVGLVFSGDGGALLLSGFYVAGAVGIWTARLAEEAKPPTTPLR